MPAPLLRGSSIPESRGHLLVTGLERRLQCCQAFPGLQIDVGAPLEQEPDHLQMTVLGCIVEDFTEHEPAGHAVVTGRATRCPARLDLPVVDPLEEET